MGEEAEVEMVDGEPPPEFLLGQPDTSPCPMDEDLRNAPKGMKQSAWEDFGLPYKSWYPQVGSLYFSQAQVEGGRKPDNQHPRI